jgi:N-acetylglucosamine kinase
MSLSGCEQEETNRQLKEGLQKNFPQLSSNYVVCSDTVGSIAAALENGMYQYQPFLCNDIA